MKLAKRDGIVDDDDDDDDDGDNDEDDNDDDDEGEGDDKNDDDDYSVNVIKNYVVNLGRLFPLLDEPRISLPETFGACMKTPLKMNITMSEGNVKYPTPWSVNWYHVRNRKGKRHRTLQVANSATLTVANPLPEQTGQLYEADVRNTFGLARGVTRILVTEGNFFCSNTW